MQIVETGIMVRGVAGTAKAMYTFPHVIALASGTLLATCRTGSTKDSADERIELRHSHDNGKTWSAPWQPWEPVEHNGLVGTLKICYLTELAPGRILAASMWIDRTTYPGQPLFNAQTEGCLPMEIMLAESTDEGVTWSPWRHIPLPAEIGPASLTSPILQLGDGSLAMSIETNKHYLDAGQWLQKVVFFHSTDQGQTWSAATTAGFDPTGRIFNWDLRCGVAPDGRIATFAWTYDTQITRYLNIHRRISTDHGHTWSPPDDLGITDQAGHPAMLPDGRVLLVWVDRFQTQAIRARLAPSVDAPFDPASEVVIYQHQGTVKQDDNTGDLLAEMASWSYGLPDTVILPTGEVLVCYYAGDERTLDVHWARLRVD